MTRPADDEPVLPKRTTDEEDVGWGDEPASDRDELRRLLDERPPHHVERGD